MRRVLSLPITIIICLFIIGNAGDIVGDSNQPQRNLYVVGTSHLDTQWRWTIQNTINEYVPATFRDNFKLMDIYPDYVFSFEGAFKYMLLKEYYPDLYARLKPYMDRGQWRLAGSWVDAADVNIPSFESLVRQTLYGNGYYKKEFGKTSCDVFLPDCFGFGYALPSLAAHCGLKSFSTQKLTWGCSVPVPFDIGIWRGVDKSSLVAGINPGSYVTKIRSDLSMDTTWYKKASNQGDSTGFYSGYMYFGTGDTGGSPDSESVSWLDKSLKGTGPIKVHSIGSDDLSGLVAEDKNARLKVYDGELLMTRHGVGCYTSQAAMKRWNRKNELLADATERACVIADLLGASPYPREALRDTWVRFLWHQFHDDLTGTSIPEAYRFSWNDELLCQNRLAAILEHAVGAVASQLDTRVKGTPVVVYNPVSASRNEIVEASIPLKDHKKKNMRVFDYKGDEVFSQSTLISTDSIKVTFMAETSPVGFAVYDFRPDKKTCQLTNGLKITTNSLENEHFKVALNQDGDVSSIYDKISNKELLAAPITFQMLHDKPKAWPAWEIQYEDIKSDSFKILSGPAEIKIIENGPARVALEIKRKTAQSNFRTVISLAAESDRVEFDNQIDWYEKETLLKAAFKVNTPNDSVTYDIGLGTIKRGLNIEKKYEVPGHQWADISSPDSSYGVAILNDCKYGWDHPDPATVRLSLIHTPGVYDNWSWVGDQSSQDMGHHEFKFAVVGHKGDWRDGEIVWEAAAFNQPMMAFGTAKHKANAIAQTVSENNRSKNSLFEIGKYILSGNKKSSLNFINSNQAIVSSIKCLEKGDGLIIRIREIEGVPTGQLVCRLNRDLFQSIGVTEVNGIEDSIGRFDWTSNEFTFSLEPYQTKAFEIGFIDYFGSRMERDINEEALNALINPDRRLMPLPYNLDAISYDSDRNNGDLDNNGNTIAGELLPDTLNWLDIPYVFGPKADGQLNALSCQGQTIDLPQGEYNRIYVLAASTGGPSVADFKIGDQIFSRAIPDYATPIGQWNSRLSGDEFVDTPDRIAPAYINQTPVAWYGSHRHTVKGENEAYQFTYLYLLDFDIPKGATKIVIPNNPNVKIFAATEVIVNTPNTYAAQPLCDRANSTLSEIHSSQHNFLDSTLVSISCPIPGAIVHFTIDGSEPSLASSVYAKPFYVSNSTTVKSRAFLPGADDHYIAQATFSKLISHDAVQVEKPISGLNAKYYEGAWSKLPDFNLLKIKKPYITESITLPEFSRQEEFGLTIDGFIRIPTEGLYTFYLSSDDGSSLTIGDSIVIDNDGLHGEGDVAGDIGLKAGYHPITVQMFQNEGDRALSLLIDGPGIVKRPVPADWLFHKGTK